MKKILLLIILFQLSFAFAQCTISGVDQMQVGERQMFTVAGELPGNTGFQWSHNDQQIILEKGTEEKSVTVKAAIPGEASLSVIIINADAKINCDKKITIIPPTGNLMPDNEKCIIKTEAFKESRSAKNQVTFEPETANDEYTYLWTVSYRNGGKKTSTNQKGQFDYSMENVIDSVELKITFKNCSKNIAKNYDTNFWYFF